MVLIHPKKRPLTEPLKIWGGWIVLLARNKRHFRSRHLSCPFSLCSLALEPSQCLCIDGSHTVIIKLKKINHTRRFIFFNLGWLDSNQRDGGTKNRCLTTWRHPNIELSHTLFYIIKKTCQYF